MRILFINPSFPPDYTGGAEVSLLHTATALQKRGVDCMLLVLNNRRALAVDEWYKVDTLPIRRVKLDKWLPGQETFDPRLYRIVRQQIRDFRPDIVHIHNVANMSLAPFIAAKHENIPIINTLHDLWLICPNNMRYQVDGAFCDPKQFPDGCNRCFKEYMYWAPIPQRRRIFQILTQCVHTFICPSQALIERHVEVGYDRQRFRMIPYGFEELIPLTAKDKDVEKIQQLSSEHRILLFGGGGAVTKGPQVVLDALPALIDRVDKLLLVVTGGGEGRFLDQFREYSPTVQILGRIDPSDMRLLFAAAGLTLVASTWHENSPVVIYESFQAGAPCVGSAFGGIPELIEEDKTGYLFHTGNASELVDKVARHFNKTPTERRTMRHHCVQLVQRRLGLDAHLAAHLELYEQVLKGN